jgi:hypothetical protein
MQDTKGISKNIEKQLNSFETDFCKAKHRFEEVEDYWNMRIGELRTSVKSFENPNDMDKWSDIISGLEELQSIVDKILYVDCSIGNFDEYSFI